MNRRGKNPRKSGRESTAATGAKKRQEAAAKLAQERAETLPPPEARPSAEDRARALLAAHKIPVEPAALEVAKDLFKAGDVADHLFREALASKGEAAGRCGTSMAALFKHRRAVLKDLGLPGDPDERDPLVGRRPPAAAAVAPAPAPVAQAASKTNLDRLIGD